MKCIICSRRIWFWETIIHLEDFCRKASHLDCASKYLNSKLSEMHRNLKNLQKDLKGVQ